MNPTDTSTTSTEDAGQTSGSDERSKIAAATPVLVAFVVVAAVVVVVVWAWSSTGDLGGGARPPVTSDAPDGTPDREPGLARADAPQPERPPITEAAVDGGTAPTETAPDTTALVEIAEQFMAARAAHDLAGVQALLAPGASIVPGHEWIATSEEYPALVEWERVAGWNFDEPACNAVGPALVVCEYTLTTTLSDALGTGPYAPHFTLEIDDDRITRVHHERLGGPEPQHEGDWMVDTWYLAFKPWLAANHPEDHAVMFADPIVASSSLQPAALSADSLRLWEDRLADYLVSLTAT